MTRRFPDNLVYGFHGTSDAHVPGILRDGFQRSTKPWDWLGHAAYFWEGDFERAAEWAPTRVEEIGGSPVVLRATIDLAHCCDLTIQKYRSQLAKVAAIVMSVMPEDLATELHQTEKRRELDCYVLNSLFSGAVYADGTPVFTTVRGLFREGEPLYAADRSDGTTLESGIYSQDHIQIGVLHQSAILDIDVMYLD